MSACFICNKSLDEGTVVTVKERGVHTLLLASIKREEKEHELLLTNLKSISVHKACQKQYADERKAAAAVRRRLSSMSSQSPAPSQTPDAKKFDFTNKCFICMETIPIDFEAKNRKMSVHLRKRIHTVKKFSIVKNTIFKFLEKRCDELSLELAERIRDVSDVDGAGAKYHRDCLRSLHNPSPTGLKRPRVAAIDEAMESVYAFISENDECQFKLSQLANIIEGDHRPDLRTMKKHLQQKYGEDICIFDCKGHDAFVCLKSSGYKILSSTWYEEKKADEKEERLRVVREAAAIILEDIRSKCYDTDTYPASDDFMSEVDVAVPESLRLLLTEVITKSKRNSSEKWSKKCTSIAHSIIAAVRPRSFFSPLQVGVAALDEDLFFLPETEAEDGELQADDCVPSCSKQLRLA